MGKKYGEPFERKHLLKHGDVIEIERLTPYAYATILKMLDGRRKMQPEVEAVANRLADEREAAIEELRQPSPKVKQPA
jgi:hypothetical protein